MALTVGNLTNHFCCYEYLWNQCEEGSEVCDVTIKFQGGELFKVHWCVLLQCPYFKALYDSGMRERTSAMLELSLVPPDVAKLALKFMYLRCVKADREQMGDLLKIADYIQLDTLRDACSTRLIRCGINEHTCLEIYCFGELYHAPRLQEEASGMLISQFEKVINGEDILEISVDFLMALLKLPALNRIRAKSFFDLIVRWTEASADRVEYFPRIFACLDLKDIPLDILQDEIVANNHVRHHEVCKQLVEDHLRLIASGILDPMNPQKEVILITGRGVLDHQFNQLLCYAYVIEDDHWTQFASIPQALVGDLTVINDKAYISAVNFERQPPQHTLRPPDDEDKRMKVYALSPPNVRKQWTHVKTESVARTYKVFCSTSSDESALLSVVMVKNSEIRLKMYPDEYLQWCSQRSTANLPNKMASSVRILKIPEAEQQCKVSASMVCYGSTVFVYVRLDQNKERKRSYGFFYNLRTNVLKRFSGGLGIWGEVLYLEGKTAYLESIGNRFSFVCDMTEMSWFQHARGLPYLPNKPVIKEYSLVQHRSDLYALCLTGRKSFSTNTLYQLNREDFCWQQISDFPLHPGLSQLSCSVMSVNKLKVRCPADCRDCRIKLDTRGRKKQPGPLPNDPHDLEDDDVGDEQ